MNVADLPALTVADLQSRLRRKEVSPREVIESLHRRIDSSARGTLRTRRLEAQLRTRLPIWCDRIRVVARPSRSADKNGARFGVDHECDGGLRSARFNFAARSGARLHKKSRQ